MSFGYDIKSEKWLSLWKLNPLADPDYHDKLFKYFKSLCMSMNRIDLIMELDYKIKEGVEDKLGTNINLALWVYKNLPALNSMTRSRNPAYKTEYVYKLEIKMWLDNIESWIFGQLVEFEPTIRFREAQKIM